MKCECGECRRCKHRAYMRLWYQRMSVEQRRAWVKRRDPEKVRAAESARYERDKEKRRALNERWLEDDGNRAKAQKAKNDWIARNPEKCHAQNELKKAVMRGEIERMPCEVCGEEKVHAHHDDYSRPLDVRWLCPAHHSEHHKRLRRGVA